MDQETLPQQPMPRISSPCSAGYNTHTQACLHCCVLLLCTHGVLNLLSMRWPAQRTQLQDHLTTNNNSGQCISTVPRSATHTYAAVTKQSCS